VQSVGKKEEVEERRKEEVGDGKVMGGGEEFF